MKIQLETISQIDRIHKYAMFHQHSKRWRRTFYACIDHTLITPVVEQWQTLGHRRKDPSWPKLLEVIVSDDKLVDLIYSDDDAIYESSVDYAKMLATELLTNITNEDDLFQLILDKDFNWAYPNIIHEHVKVLAGAVIYNINENLGIESAIHKSEAHFSKELPKKDIFLKTLVERNISSFEEF